MNTLFAFLAVFSMIAIAVFFILWIIDRVRRKGNKKLAISGACLVIMIGSLIGFYLTQTPEQRAAAEARAQERENASQKEKEEALTKTPEPTPSATPVVTVTETPATTPEQNVDSATSKPEIASETTSPEPNEKTERMNEETFIEIVEDDIRLALAPRDEIKSVELKDRTLYIDISLENNGVTLKRFSHVTDKILLITEGYDFWDTVTVDFGSLGTITKNKDDISTEETEPHFIVSEEDIVKN